MLKNARDINAYMQGDLSLLIEPTAEQRLIPYDLPEPEEEGVEVAGLMGSAGRLGARIISGDVSNTFGSAYERLQRMREEAEAKAEAEAIGGEGALPPREQAIENLAPEKDLVPPMPGEGPGIEKRMRETERRERLDARRQLEERTPSAFEPELVPTSIVDDAVKHDEYVQHSTLGDEDLDKIFADRLNRPELKDGMLGGLRVEGARGDAKIPDEGNVRQLVSSMGDALEAKFAKMAPDRVQAVSLEQLRGMADLLGEDPNRLAENFMGGLQVDARNPGALAAQMIAGKDLLISEMKVLDRLADIAAEAPLDKRDQARLDFMTQARFVADLQADFKGTQTDIARALGALRAGNRTDAALTKRNISALLDDIGGAESIDGVIDAYIKNPEMSDRIEMTRGLHRKGTWGNAIYEVWINSILSGYWSHVKNITGGIAMIMSDAAEMTVAAAIGGVITPGRGKYAGVRSTGGVTFGDVRAQVFGQMMSLREAVVAAGKAGYYREDPSLVGLGSKLDDRHQAGVNAFSAAALGIDKDAKIPLTGLNWAKTVDVMGTVLTAGRAPLRALQAEDAFFKVVAYRGSLYEQAYRSARAEGLKGEEMSKHIADFVFHPPEEAIEIAQDHARYVTLQTEMQGNWKTIQKGLNNKYLKWLVPFYKTPTNAVLYVAERSPVAPFTRRYKEAFEAGGPAAEKAQARWALGNAVAATLFFEIDQDNITGGISSSKEVRANYERMGIKPYHIRIGDTWYPYNVFEPVATLIGIVADTKELMNHPDTTDREAHDLYVGLVASLGYNLSNKTFLAGISKAMDMIRSKDLHRAKAFFDSYATSMVPGSAILNDIRKHKDEMRRYRVNVLDKMADRLPGFSETLSPQRDLWGRETMNSRVRSPYKPDIVSMEMKRTAMEVEMHKEHYNADVEFSPAERDFYHEKAGKYAFQQLKQYMQTKEFKKLQALSIGGSNEATEEIHNNFMDEIKLARADAEKELLAHPVLGVELNAEIARVANAKNNAAAKFEKLLRGQAQ